MYIYIYIYDRPPGSAVGAGAKKVAGTLQKHSGSIQLLYAMYIYIYIYIHNVCVYINKQLYYTILYYTILYYTIL